MAGHPVGLSYCQAGGWVNAPSGIPPSSVPRPFSWPSPMLPLRASKAPALVSDCPLPRANGHRERKRKMWLLSSTRKTLVPEEPTGDLPLRGIVDGNTYGHGSGLCRPICGPQPPQHPESLSERNPESVQPPNARTQGSGGCGEDLHRFGPPHRSASRWSFMQDNSRTASQPVC